MNQELLKKLQNKYGKKNPAQLKAGDTVRVYEKVVEKEKVRTQVFEGLVLATKHGQGLNGSFIVRKISVGGVGVEKIFPLHSPNLIKIERVKSAKINRSKIYYMRGLFGKAAKIKSEYANPKLWEEKGAEEELEKIKEETAQAAEEAAEEKEEEEAKETSESEKDQTKENSKDDTKDQEPEKENSEDQK